MVVLHSQFGRPNMWPCHIELSKQPTPTPPFTLSNLDRFREQVFRFTWFAWVLLHDLGGLLIPIIIRFSSVFTLYSFHIRFRKYPFSYLFPVFLYSFLLPHKNMKTNVAPLSSVRFRSVFIPTFGFFPYARLCDLRAYVDMYLLVCTAAELDDHTPAPSWGQRFFLFLQE
jgi:hypothetical protein